MKQIEFTMDKIFTFGNKDAEHRFMIRNHFLKNCSDFKGLERNDAFEVIIDIKHIKNSIDIDNVPKVIIDAFSASQIERDLCDLARFKGRDIKDECKTTNERKSNKLKALSAAKQKEYAIISDMSLYTSSEYESLGLYKDDTIEYIQKLTCTVETVNADKPSIHVIIRLIEK